jgi:hypothetical protein
VGVRHASVRYRQIQTISVQDHVDWSDHGAVDIFDDAGPNNPVGFGKCQSIAQRKANQFSYVEVRKRFGFLMSCHTTDSLTFRVCARSRRSEAPWRTLLFTRDFVKGGLTPI